VAHARDQLAQAVEDIRGQDEPTPRRESLDALSVRPEPGISRLPDVALDLFGRIGLEVGGGAYDLACCGDSAMDDPGTNAVPRRERIDVPHPELRVGERVVPHSDPVSLDEDR
jgi:hypothetical protein